MTQRIDVLTTGVILAAFLGALGMTSHALAFDDGVFTASGRDGTSCSRCHSGSSDASIAYTLVPVEAGLPPIETGYVPGAVYDVTVSITGGPSVQFGFAWDSDGGSGVVTDPTNTKLNTNPSFPANFTFKKAGSDQSSWGFQWVAPTDGATVTFWGAGNSTNGNGAGGDSPTSIVSFQADPLDLRELACRTGNVNGAAGSIADVLFLNGSPGDGVGRELSLGQFDPFLLSMAEPPSIPGGPAKFVLYFWLGAPTAATVRTLPLGLGDICKPVFLTDPVPATLKKVTNNIGFEAQLGTSDFPSTPAPSNVLDRPNGIGKVATVYVQGLVLDTLSPQGQAAVTNGLLLHLLP